MHNLQVSPLAVVTESGLISSPSRVRHKKCNEEKPRCSQCLAAGWKCDFVSDASARVLEVGITPLSSARLHLSATPLLDSERRHMEYFRSICARDVALFFELPIWETIMLQGVQAEPTLHHAALAIGALSRSRYHPDGGRNITMALCEGRRSTSDTALQDGLESPDSGTPSRLDILQEGMLQLGAQFSDSSSVSHSRSENSIMK
jgi:hypothetical protein